MVDIKSHFHRAADVIANADALVIAAGAGIGVDSGLPDFRGNAGFWNAYPALAKAQINFTDIANPRAFHQQPELAWGFYGHRLGLYRKTVPHAGFGILKKWAAAKKASWVFTSNVDGQFQIAGFSADKMHECHGSIHHLQCMDECTTDIWSADEFIPEVDEVNCLLLNEPPMCPRCGALARPNVLMFGDWSWTPMRTAIQSQREEEWLEAIGDHQRIVVVELGAGTAIPSVRNFSQRSIYEFGGRLIRINPREFQVPSSVDVGIPMGSLEALVGIDAAMGDLPDEMDLDFT
ncbi:NAD-dependent deacetylase [bacterium]|jgi:NAD-dependent SIR2 family protein deacetylase|nr:NAD-dependent deacetylase [bacterium]